MIPAELRELHQWVIWRYERREGDATKVPYRADGRGHASVADPSTWSTYAEALKAGRAGGVDRVGFVFTAGDPYAGVDLDDCLIDGQMHPAARAIVEELDSYTEYSPSGTGLHVIVRASVPEGGPYRTSKTPWGGTFESYDRERFFCMTGRALR